MALKEDNVEGSGRKASREGRVVGDTEGAVMTLSEIARYLKVSEKTILRMVQASEIPGAKVSSQWRFLRPMIDDWLSSKMMSSPKEDLVKVIGTADSIIPLSRLVSRDRVVMDVEPGTLETVLKQLVKPLANQNLVENAEEFLGLLLEREAIVSTGIEKGVAIPHALDPEGSGVRETCIVLGICRGGTEFKALLGGKTHVFCLLCADSVVVHVRLLAKAGLMFRVEGIVADLCAAAGVDDVIRVLREVDAALGLGKEVPEASSLR
jgi:PTS system nitrogen regulatory IIA component